MSFFNMLGLNGLFGGGQDRFTKTPLPRPKSLYLGKSATWEDCTGRESELYRTTPELFAVVNKRAEMFSNGIYKHYRVNRNGKVEEVNDSAILKVLEKPNVVQSRNEWMENRMINQSLYGNDYTFANYALPTSSVPAALWNLIPNRMGIHRTGKIWRQVNISDIIEKYEYRVDGGVNDIFMPNDIFHNKTPNPEDPLIGISPLEALQMPLSNIRLSYGFRNIIMKEHGALGFITASGGDSSGPIPLSEEQRQQIEDEYSKDYGMFDGQSRFKIIDTPVDYKSTTFPTKDMMLFEEVTADKLALIDAYGLNIHVFSQEKGSTFANAQEGKKMAYQDCIVPYAEQDCYGLSILLKLIEKGEWIELDYSHLECMQENELEKADVLTKKAEAYAKLKETGDFSIDNMKKIFTEFEL